MSTSVSARSAPRSGNSSASGPIDCWSMWTLRLIRVMAAKQTSVASPKILESVGCHVGVPDRVLNVLVPEVVLQGSRVVAIVGKLEPAGMAKHVRVDRECHLGGLAEALDEAVEPDGADRPAVLGNEYVGVLRVLAS